MGLLPEVFTKAVVERLHFCSETKPVKELARWLSYPVWCITLTTQKPGPFAEKSLLKQTLEHKASRRTIGELCFNFSSPKMQMITWHLRRSTWFTWFSPVDPEIPAVPLIFPWKSGDSGEIHQWLQVPALQLCFLFCMEDSIPSHHFFHPIGCFEITKTARCFSRVIFCWHQDLFFQRWTLCTRIASNKQTRSRTHLLWLHPFTKLTCFLKRGHFKVKVVFQLLGYMLASVELSWLKSSDLSQLIPIRLGAKLGCLWNYAAWKLNSKTSLKALVVWSSEIFTRCKFQGGVVCCWWPCQVYKTSVLPWTKHKKSSTRRCNRRWLVAWLLSCDLHFFWPKEVWKLRVQTVRYIANSPKLLFV